jgi:hypothetical protein
MKHIALTPGAETAIAPIESRIRDLEKSMVKINSAQTQIQMTMDSFVPDIVGRIVENVRNDGDETRTFIREQMGNNDSVCRISAEISHDSDAITWYDTENTEDSKPPFKVWCLDDPEQNQPSAEFNGVAVSASRNSDSLDTIFTKRYAADEFDKTLSRAKDQRTKDVSPYVGLVKRDGYLQLLNEFVPPPLAQRLVEKHPLPLQKILKIVKGLEQEYRYILLDRILRNEIYELPRLSMFEELERAMMANVAEKLEVTFNFFVDHIIGAGLYRSNMWIRISR